MWIYSQKNGTLTNPSETILVGVGYSGFGVGKNNPDMESVHNVGPIPKGRYDIGPAHNTTTHGPVVLALTPDPSNQMYGRSAFLIHGDSIAAPGTASHGCIIQARNIRQAIDASSDKEIQVIG